MLTGAAIVPPVEKIVPPVTDICPPFIIIIIMYIEHHSGKDVRARVTDAEGHARPGRSAGG